MGPSPEPLLEEPATQIMHYCIGPKGKEETCMNLWHLLGKFIEHNLAAQGNIGELSIFVIDCAIHALPSLQMKHDRYLVNLHLPVIRTSVMILQSKHLKKHLQTPIFIIHTSERGMALPNAG